MESSASIMGSIETNHNVPTNTSPSKLKTYGFATAIIVGIGGLAVGAAGLAGYVGAISNMAQVDAIIMMAAGGGGGAILSIIGIVGARKNRQHDSGSTRKSSSTKNAEMIRPYDTKGGLVYGPNAWKVWSVEVLDIVPEAPIVDLSKRDKVLLYIPQRIGFKRDEIDLNLSVLKEICEDQFHHFDHEMANQFWCSTAPGWVLIDKDVISESRGEDYQTLQRLVNGRGCSMPSILEAVVLNLMIFAHTGERLYGEEPNTYTHCTEIVKGGSSVVVGGFGTTGLDVRVYFFGDNRFGAACVQRKF